MLSILIYSKGFFLISCPNFGLELDNQLLATFQSKDRQILRSLVTMTNTDG